ncbi:MAG: glycosyltransferase family 39 protein [Pirellulaceae bacterium]|nr:glycosyltransferase family 39 protein [Pirellulaceae bacterium]
MHLFKPPAVLAALIVVAAGLRWLAIHEPLWLDELHTSWIVADGWSQVASRAADGNQSPLFYVLLYPLVQFAGHSEWSLRLPSLLASVALVPAMYSLTRRLTGSSAAGLLAAALVVVDRDCLFYAHEARPYALVQLVGVVHLSLLRRLLTAPTLAARWLWVAGGALLFYLHYTSVLLLAGEVAALAVLWCLPESRPAYRPRQLLVDLTLLVLLCLPATGQLLTIAGRREQWRPYVPQPTWASAVTGFRGEVTVLLPLVVVSLAAAWSWLTKRNLVNPIACQPVALVAGWAFVPRAIAGLLTLAGVAPLGLKRYVIVSAVAPLAWAALGYSLLRPAWLRGLLAAALLVLVVLRGGLVEQLRYDGRLVGDRQEDWRGAVAWLNQAAAPGAVVLLAGSMVEDPALRGPDAERWRAFCRFPVAGLYRLRDDLEVQPVPTLGERRLSARQRRQLTQADEAWLVVRGGARLAEQVAGDLRGQLPGAMPEVPLDAVAAPREFGRVLVVRLTADRADD